MSFRRNKNEQKCKANLFDYVVAKHSGGDGRRNTGLGSALNRPPYSGEETGIEYSANKRQELFILA